MALPSFYDLDDPSSNLAAAFDVPQPITPHRRTHYMAADGTTIGYGNTCDPIGDEPMLSGLDLYDITEYVPEVLQDNRITWMRAFSMPLLVGSIAYAMDKRLLTIAALSAASYMAPYPTALVGAYMIASPKFSAMRGRRNRRRAPRTYRTARARRNVRYR